MHTLRFVRFCQPLSSFFSRLALFFAPLPAIQGCLLLRSTRAYRYPARLPVARATLPRLLLHLRGGPSEARGDLVGLDLRHASLVPFLGLPRTGLQPADHDHPAPSRE